MKRLDVSFEKDPSLDRVEVIFRAPELDEEVRALMDRLAEEPSAITVFSENGVVRVLAAGEVVSASTVGRLVQVVTEEGVWFTRRTLQSLEEALNGSQLIRVSRFELVNLDKVLRYDFTAAGTLRLVMAGGMETWASRRCIPDIRKRLLERR